MSINTKDESLQAVIKWTQIIMKIIEEILKVLPILLDLKLLLIKNQLEDHLVKLKRLFCLRMAGICVEKDNT